MCHRPEKKVTDLVSTPPNSIVTGIRRTETIDRMASIRMAEQMKNAGYYRAFMAKPVDQTVDDWFHLEGEEGMESCRLDYVAVCNLVAEASAQQLRDWWCIIRGKPTGVKSSGKLMKRDLVQFVIENLGRF